jgi:hypothetical protein
VPPFEFSREHNAFVAALTGTSLVAFDLKRETIESKTRLLWRDSRELRHCATVRLRRYTKQRSRSKVRARVVSRCSASDSCKMYRGQSWTPSPGGTMMCGTLSLGRGHGHRGLAAEPWPRTV